MAAGGGRIGRRATHAVFLAVVAAAAVVALPASWRLVRPGGTAALPFEPAPVVSTPATVTYADATTEAVATRAVAGVTWPWRDRLPGWRIEFVPGEGPVAGFTWSRERRIEVFVGNGDDATALRRVLAHELGHAVDLTHLTEADRRAWRDLRGTGAAPWWPESGRQDFGTGAGDFAECFAVWLVGGELFRSELGPPPDAAQRRFLALVAAGSAVTGERGPAPPGPRRGRRRA